MAGAAAGISPGISTGYHHGFSQLQRAQQAERRATQLDVAPRDQSVMSGRAQKEALFDRTGAAWRELHIPASKPLNQSEQRALDNLNFMGGVARKDGGGYKTVRDGRETIADSRGAFNHLRNGGQVNFYESAGDEPVALRSYSHVSETARDLRERIARTQAARD